MPNISYNELMKELDKYRVSGGKISFTKEQDKFILECRDKKKGCVPYPKMLELWLKLGWGKISNKTLMSRYRELIK